MEIQQKFVTFQDMLDYANINYPNSVAMSYPAKNRVIRYKELVEAVDYFSNYINSLVVTNERFAVSLFGENSMEWMLVFLSAVVGNNIIAPINHLTKDADEIRRLIIMTEIRVVFVGMQYAALFNNVINKWPVDAETPAPVVIPLEETCSPVLELYAPSEPSAGRAAQPPRRASVTQRREDSSKIQSGPDDYAILLYTSGSINTKGVMHSQRSLLFNQQVASELLLVAHSNVVFIAGLPLSHSYGLLCGFVGLYRGSIAVYAASPRLISDNLAASAAAYPGRSLVVAGVPDLARIMNQRIMRSARGGGKNSPPVKRALSMVKYGLFLAMRRVNYISSMCFNIDLSGVFFKAIKQKFGGSLTLPIGGGPTDSVTEYGLRSVGILALSGYGTTEMAPLVAANIPKFNNILSGAVGQIPSGVEVTLIDGEVCCRGPNTMQGYLKNEEATKKAMPGDGWYHTGDKGYFVKRSFFGKQIPYDNPPGKIYTRADDSLFLVLKGRVDNQFANLRGENIYPEVIESVLMNFSAVSSCRVFESPPSHVMAQIFPDLEAIEHKLGKPPAAADVREIVAQIVKQTNLHVQSGCGIEEFEILDADFERNAFGKIKRGVKKT